MEKSLEERKVAIFFDEKQVSDKVRYEGLKTKSSKILPQK